MFLVEIYNRGDFCNVVKSFIVDGSSIRAMELAEDDMGEFVQKGDEYDNFDYRVIEMEVRS